MSKAKTYREGAMKVAMERKLKELAAAKEEAEAMKHAYQSLQTRYASLETTSAANQEAAVQWKKVAEERGAELKGLRDQVRHLTIQNAEMKGYIARINEDEQVRHQLEQPVTQVATNTAPVYRPFLARFECHDENRTVDEIRRDALRGYR